MTRAEIVSKISRRMGIDKEDCELILDMFFEEVVEGLIVDGIVKVKGFATFELSERGARRGLNPYTGRYEDYPPVKSVVCKPYKYIKDSINEY